MNKPVLLGLAAIAIAFLLFQLRGGTDSAVPAAAQQQGTQPRVNTNSATSVGMFALPNASQEKTEVNKTSTGGEQLRQQLKSAQSYRQFVLAAWQRPEDGGVLYASRIGTMCSMLAKSHELQFEKDAKTPATQAGMAAVLLNTRCDISRAEYAELRKSNAFIEAGKKDPALALTLALEKASNPVERRQLVDKVLERADPILLNSTLLATRKPAQGQDLSEVFIDGSWYAPDSPQMLNMQRALELAQCELGWDCGANNPTTLAECALRGVCHDTLEGTYQAIKAPDQDWAMTLELKRKIVAAVLAKNVQFFVPSR